MFFFIKEEFIDSPSSDLKGINKFYDNLAENDQILKIESIGKSIEDREINILKINSKNTELPLVFIDAGKTGLIFALTSVSEKIRSFRKMLVTIYKNCRYSCSRMDLPGRRNVLRRGELSIRQIM